MVQFIKIGNFRVRVDLIEAYSIEDNSIHIHLAHPEDCQEVIDFDDETDAIKVIEALDSIFVKS